MTSLILCVFALAMPLEESEEEGSAPKAPVWFELSEFGWANEQIQTDPLTLAEAAAKTLMYMKNHPEDLDGNHSGIISNLGVSLVDIEQTLAIIAYVGLYHPTSLQSKDWWERWFNHYEWKADALPRKPQKGNQVRLTRYVIYEVQGSSTKSERFPYALWETPKEELGFSDKEAKNCSTLIRCQITRADVLNGHFETLYPEASSPLVWVNESAFHEAQLQGSIVVIDENDNRHWYNVHRSNKIPYDKGTPSDEQLRYWFFKRTDGAYGWGSEMDQIPLYPGISMAGDVQNLGLGKLLWISDAQHDYIGLLSDSGGAFQSNLHQLDWFMGLYPDRKHLDQATNHLPRYATLGIIIRKNPILE